MRKVVATGLVIAITVAIFAAALGSYLVGARQTTDVLVCQAGIVYGGTISYFDTTSTTGGFFPMGTFTTTLTVTTNSSAAVGYVTTVPGSPYPGVENTCTYHSG